MNVLRLAGTLAAGLGMIAAAAAMTAGQGARTADLPMDAPAASASWGSGMEATPLPTAPANPALPWFQKLVDEATPGSTLKPPPGTYSGPVVVNKPLVIDGGGQVVIDGGGKRTVFTLETNSSTLRNLRITHSGGSHDSDDTCLNVRGNHNTVEHLTLDDCLFGIDLKRASHNLVRNNRVSSKPVELGVRGDGIRLWYSMHNRIEDNSVVDVRDMVAWYSNHNVFKGNTGARSRYSIHFMFANDNVVEGNRFYDNSVGVYLMYNERTTVRNNLISHATGPTGMAVGFKEASDALIEGNEFIYCAHGTFADLSPFQPDTTVVVRNNRFAYNGIGMYYISPANDTEVSANTFEGNLTDVAVSGGGSMAHNQWKGNRWDDFEGFDRNHDGVGDRPFELFDYADRIWMEFPYARFFRNAPLLEVLDFLERLAPFSSPNLILKDDAPQIRPPARQTS